MNRAYDDPTAARRSGIFIAVFVLLFVAIAITSTDLPDGYEETESESFRVYYPPGRTTLADTLIEEGETFLTDMRANFDLHLGGLELDGTVRIILFGSQAEFERYSSDDSTVDSGMAGYYSTMNEEIAVLLDGSQPDYSRLPDKLRSYLQSFPHRDVMVLRHELAHYAIARGGGRYASSMRPWIAEGLAMYFEIADLEQPLDAGPVHPDALSVVWSSEPSPSLQELTNMGRGAFSASAASNYGFSSLLVHLLLSRNPRAFWEFANRARREMLSYPEFEAHFGDITGEWLEYIEATRRRTKALVQRDSSARRGK